MVEKMAKFTLSDGSKVFVSYRPRRHENVLARLRNVIEKVAGKNIKVKKVESSVNLEGGKKDERRKRGSARAKD